MTCKHHLYMYPWFQVEISLNASPPPQNKGLRRAQHDTTAACRPQKFEQVYFQMIVDTLRSLTL